MGIGVNTGEAIVGNIGSEKRTKYGAMGSAINIAYRIESYTVGGQVLISPSVYDRVRSLVRVRSTREVQFKGIDQPITLYEVSGLEGRYQFTLPDKAPEPFTILEPPLPVACFPLQDKAVAEVAIPGYITRLATSAAEACLEAPVAEHTNLKLILAPQGTPELSAVYAKVLAYEPSAAASERAIVRLEFTSLAEDAQAFLDRRLAAAQERQVPVL
jgi:hypothetical protein